MVSSEVSKFTEAKQVFEEVTGFERRQLLNELQSANVHDRRMKVKHIWRVRNPRHLGQTGQACKKRLWHGTKTASAALSIAKNGFDSGRASVGAFGKGLYFSPHVCKSLNYTAHSGSNRMVFLCEVCVGLEENRMYCPPVHSAVTKSLDYDTLLAKDGCRCVQYLGETPVDKTLRTYAHDEVVVFKESQARPLFLFELEPGDGTSACNPTLVAIRKMKSKSRAKITSLRRKRANTDRGFDALKAFKTIAPDCQF